MARTKSRADDAPAKILDPVQAFEELHGRLTDAEALIHAALNAAHDAVGGVGHGRRARGRAYTLLAAAAAAAEALLDHADAFRARLSGHMRHGQHGRAR
jgi:hypothetical protein